MKEIEIIEVPIPTDDFCAKACVELRNEVYFIGLKNNPERRISIQFADLAWLRKHFGTERSESSPITFDSLNTGRRNEIANYKLALKVGVPMWEFHKIDLKTKKIKINPETEKPIYTYKLGESGRILFQRRIDEGLYTLYKYV